MTRRSLLLALGALGACVPEFDVRSSAIDGPRVLAVRAEPAEARPGTHVSYEVLAVTPAGRDRAPGVLWSQCAYPRPSVESGAVNSDCYTTPGAPLESSGVEATGVLPLDACARFGSDPPPGDARPRDPDLTGGFYQPIILQSAAGNAVHLQRVVCNPRSAPVDVARAYAALYRANQNPAPPTLALGADTATTEATHVRAGADLDLIVEWRADDAEAYAWIDPVTSTLGTRREGMLVSWFATAGSFAIERSEVPEEDVSTRATNTWLAPARSGRVVLWAVLRDSRGGTAFVEHELEIE